LGVFNAYLDCDSACWTPEPTVGNSEAGWRSAVLFLSWDCADYHGGVAVLLRPWVCEVSDHPDTGHGAVALSGVFDYVLIDKAIVVFCKCVCGSNCAVADEDVTHAH
jgi:hypothetical protein